jgi:hypothetical protein
LYSNLPKFSNGLSSIQVCRKMGGCMIGWINFGVT